MILTAYYRSAREGFDLMGYTNLLRNTGANAIVLGGKIAGATLIGLTLISTPVLAQTTNAATAKASPTGAWVKLCNKRKFPKLGKDKKVVIGKDKKVETEEHTVCRTQTERFQIVFNKQGRAAAAPVYRISTTELKDKGLLTMSVTVGTGMALPVGVPIAILNAEQWKKLEKKEQIDKKKLRFLNIPYLVCVRGSCTAETKIDQKVVEQMKKGAGLLLAPQHVRNGPVVFKISLIGFTAAFGGKGQDPKVHDKQMLSYLKEQIAVAEAAAKKVKSQSNNSAPAAVAKPK